MVKTEEKQGKKDQSLEAENQLLKSHVSTLEDHVTVLETELENKTVEAEHWKNLYFFATHKLYGKKSEAAIASQLTLFDEAETENIAEVLECVAEDEQVTEQRVKTVTRRLNKSRILTVDANTPIVEVVHEGEAPLCHCGSVMEKSGYFTRDAIAVIPASKAIVRHSTAQYKCPCCLGDEGESQTLTVTEENPSLLKGTICEPSLLATVVADKMAHGLPLYRQESRFKSMGVELSRQVMSGWMMSVASSLKPLRAALERSVREYPLWNVDETALQVLRIEGEDEPKQCFMAVRTTTARDFTKGPVIFDYLRRRTNSSIADLLGDYSHAVQSDGLSGYATAAKSGSFTHLGCLVHARRKFADILKVQKNNALAKEVLALYATFFHHEGELLERQRGKDPLGEDEYLRVRRKILGQDLDAIHDWLIRYKKVAIAKSPMFTAIEYSLKRWEQLNAFLDIPYATSGNNFAENAIRPFVLARKGFLFAQTPQGSEASALYFSLTESCKAMGINVQSYLTHLFAKAGSCKSDADWDAMIPGKADLSWVDEYQSLLTGAKADPLRTEPYILRGKRY